VNGFYFFEGFSPVVVFVIHVQYISREVIGYSDTYYYVHINLYYFLLSQ
jgi:hypothetical protein